ncbi:MAG: TonB-dependent receptor [Pseudomonadota bacterium]
MQFSHLALRLGIAAAALTACGAWAVPVVSAKPAGETAEARDAARETPVQRVEIKAAAAAYDPRRDDTASKIVVGSEEIQRYGDTSVSDVLKRLPGITVGGAGRGGTDIRMRGLGNGYTQILLNGERAPAGFSIDQLSPDVIERIEILRAASAEFSTQSIAGTINIVLKRAVKTAQREIKASYGRGKDYISPNVGVQLSDRDGGFSYSLGGNAYRYRQDRLTRNEESGTDAGGTPDLLRDSTEHYAGHSQGVNLSPRLNWTLDNGDTLTSQNFINTNRFSFRESTPVATLLGEAPNYDSTGGATAGDSTYGRSDLNWVHKLDSGSRLELKIGASASRNTQQVRQAGFNGGVSRLDRVIDSTSAEHAYSTTGKYATQLFDDHALSLGWDGGIQRRADERRQRDAALPGTLPDNSDEGFDATVSRMALYAQDEWNLAPRLSVYAGLRWEGLDTESAGNTYDAVRNRSSVWSPLFQALWKLPASKDQLRLALTRTYKAPSTASLVPRRFTSTNNSESDPDRRGNPYLKPELALGLDASYENYWAEGALLSASASLRRIDGYTRQQLVRENGRWLSSPVNDGRAVTRGIELEAKFPLRVLVPAAPALDLRASVSRNWSRVESVPGPDNRLDRQVPLSATLGLDYKTPDGVLTTGGSFAFRSGGPVRVDEQQRSDQSVRRDLDIYALYKYDAALQLRVTLSNLLAQDYLSETTYADERGVLRHRQTYPGALQARATLEMKF